MLKKWQSVFLVSVFSAFLGFAFNYYHGVRRFGFISPVVLASENRRNNKSILSPFGLLFNRDKKNNLIPSTVPLSLAKPENKLGGSVLGRSTDRQSEAASTKEVVSATTTSTSSDPSPSNTSTFTPTSQSDAGASSTSSSSTATALTASQQAVDEVTGVVLSYLKGSSYTALYNLMSADFRNTFGQDDFVASFSASSVQSASTTADPRIFGTNNDWGEQSIKLVLTDGSSQSYLNIYHLENASWTLYATQDQ